MSKMLDINEIGKLIAEEVVHEPGVAFYPGAFKPPHKGHFEAAKQLAEKPFIKQVLVLISDTDRDGITADQSYQAWQTFLKAEPNPKIKVQKTATNSPIKDIYAYLSKEAGNEDPVYIIGNDEESDDQEYFKSLRKSFGDKVKPTPVEQKKEGISASVVRDLLRAGDYNGFKDAMPEAVQNKGYVEDLFKLLGGTVEKRDLTENTLDEETLNRLKEQGYNVIKQTDNEKTTQLAIDEIKRFIDWCCAMLDVTERPKVVPITDIEYATEQSSFGGYNPDEKCIMVVLALRNLADILRTLAHEIVHHKQNELNMLTIEDGKTGSDVENEANTLAGIIMREYGRRNKNIYSINLM